MSRYPQESLRRHRQTLLSVPEQQQSNVRSKPSYGSLLTPESAELPSVQQKDKEKVSCFEVSCEFYLINSNFSLGWKSGEKKAFF